MRMVWGLEEDGCRCWGSGGVDRGRPAVGRGREKERWAGKEKIEPVTPPTEGSHANGMLDGDGWDSNHIRTFPGIFFRMRSSLPFRFVGVGTRGKADIAVQKRRVRWGGTTPSPALPSSPPPKPPAPPPPLLRQRFGFSFCVTNHHTKKAREAVVDEVKTTSKDVKRNFWSPWCVLWKRTNDLHGNRKASTRTSPHAVKMGRETKLDDGGEERKEERPKVSENKNQTPLNHGESTYYCTLHNKKPSISENQK